MCFLESDCSIREHHSFPTRRSSDLTGGHSLYVKDGKPTYCYNFFGLERYYARGTEAIPPGDHQVRMEFAYDGGGVDRKSTRLNSSHLGISYAVFCLEKKNIITS